MKLLDRLAIAVVIAVFLLAALMIIATDGWIDREPVPAGFSRFAR